MSKSQSFTRPLYCLFWQSKPSFPWVSLQSSADIIPSLHGIRQAFSLFIQIGHSWHRLIHTMTLTAVVVIADANMVATSVAFWVSKSKASVALLANVSFPRHITMSVGISTTSRPANKTWCYQYHWHGQQFSVSLYNRWNDLVQVRRNGQGVFIIIILIGAFISIFPKSTQNTTGLKALKPAADGRYLMCKSEFNG